MISLATIHLDLSWSTLIDINTTWTLINNKEEAKQKLNQQTSGPLIPDIPSDPGSPTSPWWHGNKYI